MICFLVVVVLVRRLEIIKISIFDTVVGGNIFTVGGGFVVFGGTLFFKEMRKKCGRFGRVRIEMFVGVHCVLTDVPFHAGFQVCCYTVLGAGRRRRDEE